MAITTVLFDLDGVVRHFDPDHLAAVEARHGLAPGTLPTTAFAADLIDPLITGRLTRADWTTEIGRRVGSPAAADEWLDDRGALDPSMLELIDELRAEGYVVAVLTNGSDTIPAEVEALGLADRVDRVFNTAEIGHAKPDRRAFEHVCSALGVAPAEVFFTDDSPGKLGGAVELGMTTFPFTGVDDLRRRLIDLGLAVTPPN